jgi:hypothetical protein
MRIPHFIINIYFDSTQRAMNPDTLRIFHFMELIQCVCWESVVNEAVYRRQHGVLIMHIYRFYSNM